MDKRNVQLLSSKILTHLYLHTHAHSNTQRCQPCPLLCLWLASMWGQHQHQSATQTAKIAKRASSVLAWHYATKKSTGMLQTTENKKIYIKWKQYHLGTVPDFAWWMHMCEFKKKVHKRRAETAHTQSDWALQTHTHSQSEIDTGMEHRLKV